MRLNLALFRRVTATQEICAPILQSRETDSMESRQNASFDALRQVAESEFMRLQANSPSRP